MDRAPGGNSLPVPLVKLCNQMPLRFNVDIVNMVIAARGEMVESGRLPSVVKRFLENVELYGNPYGESKTRRGEGLKERVLKISWRRIPPLCWVYRVI